LQNGSGQFYRQPLGSMSRQNVDVIILIEHVVRELDITCAVKYLLENRGLSVAVASTIWNVEETIQKYNPRVVGLPYCHSVNDPGIREVVPAWKDAVFLNLAYEQIFTKINQPYKSPRDEFSRKHAYHLAWGDFFADYLKSYEVPEQSITVTGNPVYELYRDPYKAYFEPRETLAQKYQLDPDKKWVLIPENYGAAFYSDYKIHEFILAGISPEVAYGYREFARASFDQAVIWWYKAGLSREIELIVRPRPAVARDRFRRACEAVVGTLPEHFHVIKDGTVREWILASDVMLSSYSTSLIEAAVAHKNIYMIEPVPFPDYVMADWYQWIPKLETSDHFLDAVFSQDMEANYSGLLDWAEGNMMANGDAILNIADLLAGMLTGDRTLFEGQEIQVKPNYRIDQALKSRNLPFLFDYGFRVMRSEWGRIRNKKPIPSGSGHEKDHITDEDIAWRTNRWAEILN